MSKPISPALHGALDYGMLGVWAAVPRLLELPARFQVLAAAMGTAHAGLNAVTDQPYAVRPVLPFRVHGKIEKFSIPVFLALPMAAGAWKDRRACAFFLTTGAILAATYNLTDWEASYTKA